MPNDVEIVVTGRDAGATKVLDDVTASSRATEKAQQKAAEASKLAADVMKEAGGTVRAESVRLVQAKLAERKAAEDLARVQADARKGYLDEANAARVTAAAMENLARAKMQVASINAAPPPKPMSLLQAGQALERKEAAKAIGSQDFLRDRLNEHLGGFGISESMGGLAAGVAAATVGAGALAEKMREAVSESLEFGEQMSRAAVKTGLSVETLSTLHYAAKTTGGDFEGMSASVAKMDKTIGAATEGNKKAQAFLKALGLDANDLAGRTDGAEIAFRKFASTLASTENPVRRVELATGLLGKTGAEQIPTLIELGSKWEEFRSGAERTGNMLDGKTAAALQRTRDRLAELSEKARGAGLAFTEGFLPALDQMLNVFSGPGTDGMQAFKALGEDIGRVFEFAAGRLYDTAAAAAALASVAAGGPFTETGKHLAEMAQEFDVKGAKLEYSAVTGRAPQPTAGDRAYQAGLGNAPGGETDPVLAAIRKRNEARGNGFEGVGDLTGAADKAARKRLKQMEADLAGEKLQFGVTLKAEYDFWEARKAQFKIKSDQYNAIIEKQAALAVEGAKRAHEDIVKAGYALEKDGVFHKKENPALKLQAEAEGNKAVQGMARGDAQAQESRYDTSNEIYAIQQRMQLQLAEMAVRQQVGKTLTEEAAAMQIAAIHAHAYEAELERLEAKRKALAENPLLSSGEADQQRKIDELTRRIAELQAGRQIETAQDTYAIRNADQTAVKGATDALEQFRMEALDTARQMHELTTAIMNGVHAQLLNAVTGKKTDFRSVGEQAATGVADMALKKMEANAMDAARPLLDKLGLGAMFAKKRDGSSASTALYVEMAGAGKVPGSGATDELSRVLGIGLPGVPEYKNGSRPWDEAGAKIPGVTEPDGIFASLGKLFGLGGGKKAGGDSGGTLFGGPNELGGGGGDSGSTTDTLLSGLSGLAGGMFGGGGKGDGKSPSSPLYVKNVGGADSGSMGGLGGLTSMFGGGDSGGDSGDGSGGGLLSMLTGLFGSGGGEAGADAGGGFLSMLTALPGFADGVEDFAGGPALVGERGPEIVNLPRGSSVTPNHKAFGGPSYHHHGDINIDAGAGVDKEELKGYMLRAVDQRMQTHLRGVGAGMTDARSRVPSSRRSF